MILTHDIQGKIKEVAKKHDISLLVLFGSQSTGKTHAQSDVDIAYLAKTSLEPAEEGRLITDLMSIVKTNKIDIVCLKGASPLLLQEVMTKGTLLYEADASLFNEFYLYALKRFQEAAPLFRIRSLFLRRKGEQYAKELHSHD